MKNKKMSVWIPTIVTFVLTVLCAIYYTIFGARLVSTYLQIAVGVLVPAIFPVLGLITKRQYAISLPITCAVLVVLGIHFAKALDFYSFVPSYDKLLHTNFGLMGSAMLYTLLLRWKGDKMPLFAQMLFVFLGILGVGALWEILEYVCSLFTGEDPQRCWVVVKEAIETGELGINPVRDTVQDLTVTAIGSAIFYLCYFLDKFCSHGKLYDKLFRERGDGLQREGAE